MEPRCSPPDKWQETARNVQEKIHKTMNYGRWLHIERGDRSALTEHIKCKFKALKSNVPAGVESEISPGTIGHFCELIYGEIRDAKDFGITVKFFYYLRNFQNHQNYTLLEVNSTCGHSFFLDGDCRVHNTLDLPQSGISGSRTFKLQVLRRCDLMALMKFALFKEGNPYFTKMFAISTAEENAKVIMMCDTIYNQLDLYPNVYVTFSCVIGNADDTNFYFPVINFRAQFQSNDKPQSSFFVLDHFGRVYKSWDLFEKKNKYPKLKLCYPPNGVYEGDEEGALCLKFALSPACGFASKLNFFLRETVKGISLFAPFLDPVSMTICLISVALYEIYGCSSTLYDRAEHKQSISLRDPIGRECWLGIAGNVALAVSGGLGAVGMANLVAESELLGYVEQALFASGKIIAMGEKIIEVLLNVGEQIFKFVKETAIHLKDKILEIGSKIKEYLVGLWYYFFPPTQASNETAANCISENLAQKNNTATEDEFLSLCHFMVIFENHRLKQYQKLYEESRSELDEIPGDPLDYENLDKQFGITSGCDRDVALLEMVRKKMHKENLKEYYHKALNDAIKYNNCGDLKFKTDAAAVNAFFHSVVEVEFLINPEEFFNILRKVTSNNNLITGRDTHEGVTHVKYYDESYPLSVTVYECEGERYLEDCKFEEIISSISGVATDGQGHLHLEEGEG